MSNWVIKTNALSKRYDASADCALNSITLEIETGTFFGLLGPNGSGKTTFISILCGLLAASDGDAYVCQHHIKSMTPIKPLIGLVPQNIALYPSLTLKENLRFFASLYNIPHKQTTKKINEYLNIFELEDAANKMVHTFSGGMLRRANLVAGILHDPKLLFLDEPTANVDAQARNMIFNKLQHLHSKGMSIVYTTHYMEEVEALCSRIAILKKGNIVALDSLNNLKNRYPEKANFTENIFVFNGIEKMFKFIFLIYKDYLLLWRDKIGLCVLFFMPMFFVFTITLLQSERTPQAKSFPIMVVNYDQGDMMQKLEHGLSDKVYSIQEINNPDASQLKITQKKVAAGIYKLLIIIPVGTSNNLTMSTQQSITNTNDKLPSSPKITLLFDPAINPALQEAAVQRIRTLVQTYKMQIMKNIVGEVLGTSPSEKSEAPLPLQISYAGNSVAPNVVQQNIPAWALFAMFFIALPLASIMIKEREQTVNIRIRVAPVSNASLVISRLIAFVSVNFLQLWLMLCIGLFVMPLLHLPALNLSHHVGTIMLIGLFASIAATSFGLLIGTWAKTIEQASAVVPILIVLAAAVGGIMFPTYLMSDTMQIFSAYSPLHWGHEAFIDVLLRDYTATQILWPLAKLGLFSAITCGLAWWRYKSL